MVTRKSARGLAQSKSWREFERLSINAKRLGVRQPSAARQKEGVVDYGFCQFNFSDGLPAGKD